MIATLEEEAFSLGQQKALDVNKEEAEEGERETSVGIDEVEALVEEAAAMVRRRGKDESRGPRQICEKEDEQQKEEREDRERKRKDDLHREEH